MELAFQDKIDDYVMGRMSKWEQQYFHEVITNDENLQKQLEFTQHVLNAIIRRNQKIAAMKTWEQDVPRNNNE